MYERESIVPILLGVFVSVVVHLLVVPVAGYAVWQSDKLAPNLFVRQLVTPPVSMAGRDIVIEYTVTNRGRAIAEGTWEDKAYLSADTRWSADDVELRSWAHSGTLKIGEDYGNSARVALPTRARGRMFILLKTDADSTIDEWSSELDNVAAAAIIITTPDRPDLVVKEMTAPDELAVGQDATVNWVVANDGKLATPSEGWFDRVYLSRDDVVSEDDVEVGAASRATVLQPGESYISETVSFVVPESFAGRAYLIVKTDADDVIEEYPHEDNNELAREYNIKDSREKTRRPKPKITKREEPKPKPKPEEIVQLGKDEAPDRKTVAWIPHEEFEKLIARQAQTEQPAVQTSADPVPNAPMRIDASNPAQLAQAVPQVGQPPVPQVLAQPIPSLQPQLTEPTPERKSAKQHKSQSPTKEPGTPIDQRAAKSSVENDAPPTKQVEAKGPENPLSKPAEKVAAKSLIPDPQGDATRQDESALPLPEVVRRQDEALAMLPNPANFDPILRAPADSEVEQNVNPTEQEAATSPMPEDGDPTKQDKADTKEPDPEGKPTKKIESKTDVPDPEGKPVDARESKGKDKTKPEDKKTEKSDPKRQQQRPNPGQRARPTVVGRPAPSEDKPKPTSAARSDRESPPTSTEKPDKPIRPGSTVVGQGLEIKTFAPRRSVISRMTSVPKYVVARITFNKDGSVRMVKIEQSSGYREVDAGIEAAIYRWKAKGKRLDNSKGPIDITMTVIP